MTSPGSCLFLTVSFLTVSGYHQSGPPTEPVREFESEIHKSLSLNNLRVLSLIKVDSLLARTYVGERRILGQAPRTVTLRDHGCPHPDECYHEAKTR